jgi:hypothetical protein
LDKLFVAFKYPETSPTLNVPQPNGVVGASTDDDVIVILETIEGMDKFTARGVPDFDGAIT